MSDYKKLPVEERLRILENVVEGLIHDRMSLMLEVQTNRQCLQKLHSETQQSLISVTDNYTHPYSNLSNISPLHDLGYDNDDVTEFKEGIAPRRELEEKRREIKETLTNNSNTYITQ